MQEPATDRSKRAEQRLKAVIGTSWRRVQGLTRIRQQWARGHYSEALHEIAQLRSQLQQGMHELHHLRLDLLLALSRQRMGYQERVQSLLAPRQDLRARCQYPG